MPIQQTRKSSAEHQQPFFWNDGNMIKMCAFRFQWNVRYTIIQQFFFVSHIFYFSLIVHWHSYDCVYYTYVYYQRLGPTWKKYTTPKCLLLHIWNKSDRKICMLCVSFSGDGWTVQHKLKQPSKCSLSLWMKERKKKKKTVSKLHETVATSATQYFTCESYTYSLKLFFSFRRRNSERRK